MIKRKVSDTMTRHPYIASPKMTITEAANFMTECRIRHLPVLDGKKIVGIVSDRDLKKGGSFRGPGELLVEDVMTRDPYCVKRGASIGKVAKVLADERLGSAIVLDDKEEVVGIFTTTDGMRLLSEIIESGGYAEREHHELSYDSFPEYMSW